MSRADDLRATYEAELAVVELEDQLAAAKATVERCGGCGRRTSVDPPELRDLKRELRLKRQQFRETREGSAVAQPATIEVTSALPAPGGEG